MRFFPPVIIFLLFLVGVGSYLGIVVSPPDALQKDAQKIMYIHVPSAWVGLSFMFFTAVFSVIYLLKKRGWADDFAWSFAKIGSLFTAIAIITGSIWAKPIWGTWWVWEARLTTTLLLFLIYIGYILLGVEKSAREKSKRARAILSVVGASNVPIVWFSVKIWRTLHQEYSIVREGGPSIHPDMLKILVYNIAVVFALAISVAIYGGVKSYSKILLRFHQQKKQP